MVSFIPLSTSQVGYEFTNSHINRPVLLTEAILANPVMGPPVPKPPPAETIAIIIQNSLYSSVSTQVTQYQTDLNNSGYSTLLYTQTINTVQELRGNLTFWFSSYSDFTGAVLIGLLPYAQFYHPSSGLFSAETFLCDLYLMDLDGDWYDIGTPGIFDVHNATTGADTDPEIFISRIDPTSLSWGSGTAAHINTYLARAHSYRIGGIQRQRRALVYVDDDWAPYWSTVWDGDVGNAFSTRTFVNTNATTTAADWLNRLSQDYMWTHLCAHSGATFHQFKPSAGTVTSAQVRAVPPSFNFYNLFSCHGAEWTVTDNLAVTYAFSGSYSLGVIGSAKTGGMMDCEYFYMPLGQNKTLGDSFKEWWINAGTTAGNYYLEWYYGMNLIGDPFLTIYYDCTALPPTISSITHPDQSQWYSNALPQFSWSTPPDVNGVSGYYYTLDTNPMTVPTSVTGTYTTGNTYTQASVLDEGQWYLHVVTNDSLGNVGTEAAHYQINIDNTNPIVSITSHTTGDIVNTNLTLTWALTELGSGYHFADVYIDGILNTAVTGPSTTTDLSWLAVGPHTLNVTAYDRAGYSGSDQVQVEVQIPIPPPIPGFPIEALALGAILALGLGLIQRRRKRC